MDRRDFIKHSGATAVAAATGFGATATAHAAAATPAAPSLASGVRELRLAMPWSQNGRGFDDSARRLAQSVTAMTNGRIQIVVAAEPASVDALTSGQADIYHGSGHDFERLDAAFAYFAGLPGGAAIRPTYLNAWLMAGGGQFLWDELAKGHGFKPLLAGHSGARAKLWSRDAISGLDGLKGRRIATSGLAAQIVVALGAIPVEVAPADLATALTNGSVDAVEWGGTIAGYACDLHETAKHCLRPGLSRSGFTSVMAVRTGVWDTLSPSDQAVITAAASLELNTVVAENLSVSRNLRIGLTERKGITFGQLPADVSSAAEDAARQALETLSTHNAQSRRIHASYETFRAGLPAPRRRRSGPLVG